MIFVKFIIMKEFIRARSDEQKEFRMNEVKNAAASLFNEMPYSEITLTTIASKLGWSRANLYKYVTTKEEIFLAISEEKMESYFNSLNSAIPHENRYSVAVIAEVWAGILNANQEYLRYVSILSSIIEKNVTVERLADFKKKYYDSAFSFCEKLSKILGLEKEKTYKIFLDILFFASASASSCEKNPLVQEALKMININFPPADFYSNLKDFIFMRISWEIEQQKNCK